MHKGGLLEMHCRRLLRGTFERCPVVALAGGEDGSTRGAVGGAAYARRRIGMEPKFCGSTA
jgi:hypothetical protein